MSGRPCLPRLLNACCLGGAILLGVMVIVSPWLDDGTSQSASAWHMIELLARDPASRRTAIATAIGLAATARIFFRSLPEASGPLGRKSPKPPVPPVAGA
ncbi:MAG: hypothetical protein NZ700_04100 [Gemmataceae bacterium]|nr:hypothetical protein [Gemmataceae bacterium]MDW8266102.1 hypothetical protein [Gemmataceae bacterium]